jgi:hypothetical protein
MQVTNEMVAEACFVYQQQGSMRAALEAALGARSENAATIVMSLRMACGYENLTDEVRKSCSHASNGLVIDAAACIDDLAAVLKPFAQIEIGITDKEAADMEDWFRHDGDSLTVGDFRRARTTLERWGLK